MIAIRTYRNHWVKREETNTEYYVSGWAEYENEVLDATGLIDNLKKVHIGSQDDFKGIITKLNGNFTVIYKIEDTVFIGTDRMRGYPVLYFKIANQWVVTDDIFEYQKQNKIKFDLDGLRCEQYMVSDFVFGPHTVYKEVLSLQAGEIIQIQADEIEATRTQYFRWNPNMEDSEDLDIKEEAKKQDEIFMRVFDRMVKSAPNVNNWVIPLSGGYDSRTIVNYLFKLGVKNVICFSYGFKGNLEANISRKVAEKLNYKWYFVDYDIWISKLQKTSYIDKYLEYGFNGNSLPSIQDFPAVYALKELGILKEGDVFVPGHALEVLAGSHLKKTSLRCKTTSDAILTVKRHYSGLQYYTKRRNNILNIVSEVLSRYNSEPQQMAEIFDWQERQTKFIANSVKTYEFFNFAWRIPEWDIDLFRYWEGIGFNYRFNRIMFKEIFKSFLAVERILDIPFSNDIFDKKKKKTIFKDLLINRLLPLRLKKIIFDLGIVNESEYQIPGYSVIFSNLKQTIKDYLNSVPLANNCRVYLTAYPQSKRIFLLPVNTILTLLVLRKIIKT